MARTRSQRRKLKPGRKEQMSNRKGREERKSGNSFNDAVPGPALLTLRTRVPRSELRLPTEVVLVVRFPRFG